MKAIHCSLLFLVILGACNSKKSDTAEVTDTLTAISKPTSDNPVVSERCYLFTTVKGDSIQLSLTIDGADARGSLLFALAEKDRNKGTFRGTMKGDTLFADYTFLSEGVMSVREIVLLSHQDGFVEGYGEMEQVDNKEVFSPGTKLTFDYNWVLKPAKCK